MKITEQEQRLIDQAWGNLRLVNEYKNITREQVEARFLLRKEQMNPTKEQILAEKIADRLLTLYGDSQQATLLTPSIPAKDGKPEIVGGSYCRSELIEEIMQAMQ